jgi:hypothetical protein
MTRSTSNQVMMRRLRREVKAALKLSPLVLAAVLLAAVVWRADSAAISGTFQSSIIGTVTAPAPLDTATPTATGQPAATTPLETATEALPGTATVEPSASAAAETATVMPIESPAEPTATALPTEVPLTATLTPVPTEVVGTVEPTPDDRQRYPDEETELRFEWSMLFDSVSLLLSYIWLFCGVLIFLTVPILFIVLWVASKRRQEQQE